MAIINYNLTEVEEVCSWYDESKNDEGKIISDLNWFQLTDAEYWLEFGDTKLFEYTKEAIEYFEDYDSNYAKHYLYWIIDDFCTVFSKINEDLPEEIYALTKDFHTFNKNAEKWLELNAPEDEEEYNEDFHSNKYLKLIEWTFDRVASNGFLIKSPQIYFFKRKDKIRIVWDTEWNTDEDDENDITFWTAKNGSYEMDFPDFVKDMKEFVDRFIPEMEKRIKLAMDKYCCDTVFDKNELLLAHESYKDMFYKALDALQKESAEQTNWDEILELFNEMNEELNSTKSSK